MVEPRRNMGCSLIGPALRRGREGGEARKRGDRHKREEKKRRNDWTFVCLAALVYEQAVAYAFVHRDM